MDYFSHLQDHILGPWIRHAVDRGRGGFYGGLDRAWKPDTLAAKGLVQHARLLWVFSAAYRRKPEPVYREMARQARGFLIERFKDREHHGWFYSVDPSGHPLDLRKHVYPHSFVIYAFAECARAFSDNEALDEAIETLCLLDEKAHDSRHGGYVESFSREWAEVDQHEHMGIDGKRRSMNTHIHLLEALTTLHAAASTLVGFADELVSQRLEELRDICAGKVFNAERGSLDLFFEHDWTRLASPTSYGHDIEFSWLLDEASERLGSRDHTSAISLRLAENTLKGLAKGQGLYYEGDASGEPEDLRRIWWVQAEGLVGLLNAYRLSGKKRFLHAFRELESWVFTRQVDRELGDWHEEVSVDGGVHGAKGHFWKEPYHQGRACLEVEKRMGRLEH